MRYCASHLIDRVAFIGLHSIHIHDEIESLKDPIEAVLDEFGYQKSIYLQYRKFNDINTDG